MQVYLFGARCFFVLLTRTRQFNPTQKAFQFKLRPLNLVYFVEWYARKNKFQLTCVSGDTFQKQNAIFQFFHFFVVF